MSVVLRFVRDLFLECFWREDSYVWGHRARDSSQHALKIKNERSEKVTLPSPFSFYLHLFIDVRAAEATQPDGRVAASP